MSGDSSPTAPFPLELRDLDRRIWEEELAPVIPSRIFDIHTHAYRREHVGCGSANLKYRIFSELFPNAGWRELDAADALLLPGREVHRLTFGFPFQEVDFEGINRFVVEETRNDPGSGASLLVHPGMRPESVEESIRQEGHLGLKPYRLYSTGDPNESRITDFFPESHIEVANRYGLLVTLQLSKRCGVAAPDNIADLEALAARYPDVKWIMAHCARAFYAQPLDRVGQRLARMDNVFFDTAAVCEYGSYDALLQCVGPRRIVYGSDDLPACADRGKYISWGEAWIHFNEDMLKARGTPDHCDPSMTFIRYEVLRALCRAIRRHGLGREEIAAIFHDTAARLTAAARTSVSNTSGSR